MSSHPSPTPPQAATPPNVDESTMPKGHCRYILLLPEIKGQRCACVGFSLNKSIPGATCDCGHLACFHNKDPEASNDHQRQELDMLKKRIQQLEDQLCSGQEDALNSVISKVHEVQDHLAQSREEFGEQIKGAYRNVSISWRSIEAAERKSQQQDQHIRQIFEKLHSHDQQLERLRAGQMELQDADISLEERIENLTETLEEEEELYLSRPRGGQPRRRSTSDTPRPNVPLAPLGGGGVATDRRPRPSEAQADLSARLGHGDGSVRVAVAVPHVLTPIPPPVRSKGAWTVHISLLPTASVAMPFERNTNAYQRCLSRGLHQMVAVHGRDAASFTKAVERTFGRFLKGREWMPLEARLCDAEQLQGLPMLRQMEPHMIKSNSYDHDFLRQYVAVCDNTGMIDSLYIAMRYHTISWHTLKRSEVFMEGLESAWAYDPKLDTDPFDEDMAVDDGDRPAAGDITAMPPIQPSLKRPLTEVSRSNSFSAGAPSIDVDEARAKRTRQVPASSTLPPSGTMVEMRMRGVETM